MEIKKSAVICLLQYEKSFLILKRNKPPYQYLFTPLRGIITHTETPKQAATRTVSEITGIKVENWAFCGVVTETSPAELNATNFVYLAKVSHFTEPISSEGTFEWMLFENLPNIPTPITDWYFYKYILRGEHFVFDAVLDGNLNMVSLNNELTGTQIYPKKKK